ncbi:hypothetical protein PT276_08070 [Orbaceae bacterium ESL0721]|nr:hypothetical protein [Orbaceae bacterium ESL0721]
MTQNQAKIVVTLTFSEKQLEVSISSDVFTPTSKAQDCTSSELDVIALLKKSVEDAVIQNVNELMSRIDPH